MVMFLIDITINIRYETTINTKNIVKTPLSSLLFTNRFAFFFFEWIKFVCAFTT